MGRAQHTVTRKFAAGLAVAALAAAPVVAAVPAAQAASRVTLVAAPKGLLTGNDATFVGRATTTQHRLVRLQIETPTGTWVNAGKALTRAKGRYTVSDKVSRTGTYRVVLPRAKAGRRTLGSVTSNPVTVGLASTLESGQTMQPGQFLTSPGGVYQLTMGADGNLVLTTVADPTTVVWSSNTSGHPGARLVMQFGGNLVLVDPTNLLLWNTGTADPGAGLAVGDDGSVSVVDGSTVLWDRVNGLHTTTPIGSSQSAIRGDSWVDAKVKYSQSKYFTNSYGRYRTDCSGFVSMMWALSSSYTTRTLPSISTVITKDQLQSGDILNSPGYHVVLFDAWANAAHTQYWAYEETPSTGATHHVIPYPYWSGSRPGSFVPRRLSQ